MRARVVRVVRVVSGVAAGVLLLGCGAGDEVVDDDASEQVADVAGGDGAFDCDDAYVQLLELDEAYRAAVRQATPDESVDYDRVAAEVTTAADAAPAEVQDTYQRYAEAVLPFYAGLVALGFDASDPGSTDADAYVALTDELDSSGVEAARDELQAWLTGPCEDL